MKPQSIQLSRITHTVETQSRCTLNNDVVSDYAERMLAGDKFPPIVVFEDKDLKDAGDVNLFLADGFHRVAACVRNNFKDILAEVRQGTQKDALKYSIGANRTNGLCRTNADKRHCIRLALEHFADLSDRAIADLVGVSAPTVGSARAEYEAMKQGPTCKTFTPDSRTGKDGKSYPAARTEKRTEGTETTKATPANAADEFPPAPAQLAATPPPAADRPAVKAETQVLAALKALWTQASASERMDAMKAFWMQLKQDEWPTVFQVMWNAGSEKAKRAFLEWANEQTV